MKLEYPEQNLTIINFTQFVSHYENFIVNDLYKYSLLSANYTLGNKDVKKVFYHHLIKIIIDEHINNRDGKLVLFFNTKCSLYGVLKDYFGHEETIAFLVKLSKKLENMLPIRFVITNKTLNEQMLKNACISKIKQVSKKQYNFQKIKLFAKRYELTFLNDNYLDSLKTKQVLI